MEGGMAKRLKTAGRSDVRGQHYVPRMLQAPFATEATGKKAQVHVFDKHTGATFRTAPDNILQARDFNTFEGEGRTVCLEDPMAAVESDAAPVLERIRAERSVAGLNEDERAKVCVFAALQRVRGISTRASLRHVGELLRKRLTQAGMKAEQLADYAGDNDPEQLKLNALEMVAKGLGTFSQAIAMKDMVSFEAPVGHTFLLGDCPVVLMNNVDHGPRGSIGLDVVGIEIYLPIAPDLALGFLCPSLIPSIAEASARYGASLKSTAVTAFVARGPEADHLRAMRAELQIKKAKIDADLAAFREGRPVVNDPENMDYVNSLQVLQSERHVVSATGNFDLVREMIAKDERTRTGARATMA